MTEPAAVPVACATAPMSIEPSALFWMPTVAAVPSAFCEMPYDTFALAIATPSVAVAGFAALALALARTAIEPSLTIVAVAAPSDA